MYHLELGRLMGVDAASALSAVGNPAMFNRYAYATNNPYRYIDPDGNIPVDTVWDIASIVYDEGKISVGYATNNPTFIAEVMQDLVAGIATLYIPYAPAGSSKLARFGAESVEKDRIRGRV